MATNQKRRRCSLGAAKECLRNLLEDARELGAALDDMENGKPVLGFDRAEIAIHNVAAETDNIASEMERWREGERSV
jgi:hypothetical protein